MPSDTITNVQQPPPDNSPTAAFPFEKPTPSIPLSSSSSSSATDIATNIAHGANADANADLNADAEMARVTTNADSIWLADSMSRLRRFFFVTICCLTQFCTQAAFMNTLVQLKPIGSHFNITTPGNLSWLVAGYSLTVGTFILLSGRLGDVFGHRTLVLIGLSWFTLWTLIAGLSSYSNFVLFVFCRVFQGMGPALCLPNALALLGNAYPPGHRKAMAFAFFGASAPTGAIVAALFAGMFLEKASWQWTFYSFAIALFILTLLAAIIIPATPSSHHRIPTWRSAVKDLDLVPATVGVTALILFNFAWNQAPIVGWGTAEALVPLILGFLLFVYFVRLETHYSTTPLVPLDVMTNRNVIFVLATIMFGWGTFGIWSLYLIQLLENIRGLTPLMATVYMIPVVPTGIIAAIITGLCLGPLKVPPPAVMTGALCAFMIGTVLVATVPMNQVYWGQIFVSMLIIPFGMDMSFPAATLILSNSVSRRHQGVGASLVNTVVNYGISLGVGYAGTVEVHYDEGGKTKPGLLKGYHAALYMGIGLAASGIVVCLVFLSLYIWDRKRGGDGSTSSTEKEEVGTADEREKTVGEM